MKAQVEVLEDDIRLVRLEGRLDAAGSPEVRDKLRSLAAQEQPKLIIDLSQVSFIDSSGLGALVSGLKAARQQNGDILLAGAQQQAQTLFKLTMLDQIFKVYDSPEEALAHWTA
ncbi:MAG: STAS domain-containing protein [Anaerolineae bacterium]